MFRTNGRPVSPVVVARKQIDTRTKRIVLVASAVAIAALAFFVWHHFWGPANSVLVRDVPGAMVTPPPVSEGEDGAMVTPAPFPLEVLNEGEFAFPGSNKTSTVLLDEPLPDDERAAVEAALAEIDFSSSANSRAFEVLSETVGIAGKQFILIYPAVLSCDGEAFFNGYAVVHSSRPPVNDQEAADRCESLKTLDGARALAAEIADEDAYMRGTFEVFEAGMEDADRIYEASRQSVPSEAVPEHTPTPALILTPDERQTYAGTV